MAPLPSTAAHPLRPILAASFLPAFPLCIAGGVLTHRAVPAVGLAPLAASAVSAIVLPYVGRQAQADEEEDDVHREDDETENQEQPESLFIAIARNPLVTFALDAVLAAALMIVLVFTWKTANEPYRHTKGGLYMLAAYATMPLLLNFCIHLFLLFKALYDGLAVRAHLEFAASRILPPSCPNCEYNLRPSLPEIPWAKLFRRREGYAPVLVEDGERYRDELTTPEEPEEVSVVRRESRGKSTSASSSEPMPWST
ncbi:hypothetical protein B0I35DRAFT_429032 [Stachybotrys elegans]|uniref:Uncharacterized protein n=1 Tax=Stachybotrys elegans TaxID=80388 RepID=A0A8K0SUP7_9HYPO|nr:hypothetical protein B0I35DRAFT_429032 [Stachybotrys elegans]